MLHLVALLGILTPMALANPQAAPVPIKYGELQPFIDGKLPEFDIQRRQRRCPSGYGFCSDGSCAPTDGHCCGDGTFCFAG
jgi:hypothetical protein